MKPSPVASTVGRAPRCGSIFSRHKLAFGPVQGLLRPWRGSHARSSRRRRWRCGGPVARCPAYSPSRADGVAESERPGRGAPCEAPPRARCPSSCDPPGVGPLGADPALGHTPRLASRLQRCGRTSSRVRWMTGRERRSAFDWPIRAHRRHRDRLHQLRSTFRNGCLVDQDVLAEHVVGRADVHAVAHLLVGRRIGLVAEVEPLGKALEAAASRGEIRRRRSPRMLV